MEDRQIYHLEYVNAFNLGDEASGIDQNDGVIARYEAHTDEGNYYLMLNCDLWERKIKPLREIPIASGIRATITKIVNFLGSIVKAPFTAIFSAVELVF